MSIVLVYIDLFQISNKILKYKFVLLFQGSASLGSPAIDSTSSAASISSFEQKRRVTASKTQVPINLYQLITIIEMFVSTERKKGRCRILLHIPHKCILLFFCILARPSARYSKNCCLLVMLLGICRRSALIGSS